MGITNYPSQSGLNRPPKTIVNADSAGGTATISGPTAIAVPSGTKAALSGALTASTYKAILTVTGSGVIDICAVTAVDVTSRSIGLKIVIDGTTAFEAVSSAITTASSGIVGIGIAATTVTSAATGGTILPQPMTFNSSLILYVSSDVAAGESDKVTLYYAYRTT